MNVRVEMSPPMPSAWLWLLLATALALLVLGSWALSVAFLALILAWKIRPFDFLSSFLVVIAGSSWINNVGGRLTAELGLLSVAVLIMLVTYGVTERSRLLALKRSSLTLPLFLFVGWTLVNVVRGVLAGYSAKNINLEFFPLLGIGTALLVANVFEARRDLRTALIALILIGFGPTFYGYIRATEQAHAKDIYTAAFPGIMGVLCVNLALRARTRAATLGWIGISLLFFLHQLVTLGRGLWTGCIAGLLVTFLTYAGFGRGSGTRWKRVLMLVALIIGLGLIGGLQLVIVTGHEDFLTAAGTRFTSIGGTGEGMESRSNLIRLWEYGKVLGLVARSPFIGYGVGYSFTIREPFSGVTRDQVFTHQNYLQIWLKMGLVGLALFIWMLIQAIRLGIREARRRTDPWESSWFATAAAATAFLAVLSLSVFPFGTVNEMFLLALLWGGAMSMSSHGKLTVRWRPEPAEASGG